jgi:dimethylglycine oxidase
MTSMGAGPRVVVIGAGIVGCAVADELTQRGWSQVTVLDQCPQPRTGSTSLASGAVFQVNPSRTMTMLARYTAAKYSGLTHAGRPCFRELGGLELASTPAHLAALRQRHGLATSWGVPSHLLSPDECARLHPLIDPAKVLGGLHVPSDGWADPVGAAREQARRAASRGAAILYGQQVTGIWQEGSKVQGVITQHGDFRADVVICCAGVWGPLVGAMAGVAIPLLPMAHSHVRTSPVVARTAEDAQMPVLWHQESGLTFWPLGGALGIGAPGDWPAWTAAEAGEPPGRTGGAFLGDASLPLPPDFFQDAWSAAAHLLPALRDAKTEETTHGLNAATAGGNPLIGEARELRGFWVAEAVWAAHSAGVARTLAEWLVGGHPSVPVHECDISRFKGVQKSPSYTRARVGRNFVEPRGILYPLGPSGDSQLVSVSPFYEHQRQLGAFFLELGGWARPHWYEANAGLPEVSRVPARNDRASHCWSPIAGAEALVTRQRVAMYDLTPVQRLELSGPGALDFLQRVSSNQVAKKPGSLTYTLLLGDDGGISGDMTVARLADDRFLLGISWNLDADWLRRQLPPGGSVQLCDVTAGTCCIGLWGPRSRAVVQSLTQHDFSNQAMGFFKARQALIGGVPVTALRLSLVGELGWELSTTADLGRALWDSLWQAGQPHGIIAAGRAAMWSLRLEKGYRSWGVEITGEYDPYEAGLGFAVHMDKGSFTGRQALARRAGAAVTRRLSCLVLPDPYQVVLGSEPVYYRGEPAGYVTSAGYGYSTGNNIAYAWLSAAAAVPGTDVEIEFCGSRVAAVVAAEPLFDPAGNRLRS